MPLSISLARSLAFVFALLVLIGGCASSNSSAKNDFFMQECKPAATLAENIMSMRLAGYSKEAAVQAARTTDPNADVEGWVEAVYGMPEMPPSVLKTRVQANCAKEFDRRV